MFLLVEAMPFGQDSQIMQMWIGPTYSMNISQLIWTIIGLEGKSNSLVKIK